MRLRWLGTLSISAALSITMAAASAGPTDVTADWLGYNGDYAATRYSPLAQVNLTNVAKLKEICNFTLGDDESFQAGPTIVDGMMYVTTFNDTYAIDAANCRLRWKDRVRSSPPEFGANLGVGYGGGVVFRGIYSGSVLALDAATGKHLWKTRIVPRGSMEYIDAAPIVEDGFVIIGTAGADFGARCHVVALDEFSGKVAWRFALARPRLAAGSNSTSITLDRSKGLLYVPAGNSEPDYGATPAGGNLFSGSVVVLDAETGTLRTSYRLTAQDDRDWDVSVPPSLIEMPDGAKMLTQSVKDGYLYGVDLPSGKVRYRTPVTTVADGRVVRASAEKVCTGTSDGRGWNGTAYSPETNLVYVNANDGCATLKRAARSGNGWLHAIDLTTGKIVWTYHARTPMLAAVTTTAGGVVFTGDLRGDFYAFDARDGAVVYRAKLGKPIGGGIASYAVAGKQYIAVAGGRPGSVWKLPRTPGTVAIYSL